MSAGDFTILCIPKHLWVDCNTINILYLYQQDGLFRFYGNSTTILVFYIIYTYISYYIFCLVIIIYFGGLRFFRGKTQRVIFGDVPAAGIRERFLYAYLIYL